MLPKPTRTFAILAALVAAACTATDRPSPAPGPFGPIVGSLEDVQHDASVSFVVGGHLYGDPGVVAGVPSPTLIAQVFALRDGPDRLLVSLGDFVRAPDPAFLVSTLEVLSLLDMPVLNAPGNHDYRAGDYEARFGTSLGAVRVGPALLVVLNTELSPGRIDGAQLDFVSACVDRALADDGLESVMFFGHRVVFADLDPRYASLRDHGNTKPEPGNFESDVLPEIRRLVPRKHVAWFAGDIGVAWSDSLFFDRHPDLGVTFVATGLGATRRDNLVRVTVRPGEEPRYEIVPLAHGATVDAGEALTGDIADYGPAHWDARFGSR